MSEHDAPSSFIKTPQQLIVVVLLAFVVPVIGIVLIVQLVVNRPKADPAAMSPAAVAARIAPVGKLDVGAAAVAQAPAAGAAKAEGKAPAGKSLYDAACMACHATGAANAPKLGDRAAWAPRIKSGVAALVKSALNGKGAMPPKGGAAAASEADIRAAVEYLVAASK